MKPIEFIFTLLCDDVRREDNGKELLVGVYSAGIVVNSVPNGLALMIWSQVKINEPGEYELRYRCINDEGKELALMPPVRLTIQQNKGQAFVDELASVAMGHLPITITGAGRLHIEVKIGANSPWERIKTTTVQVR